MNDRDLDVWIENNFNVLFRGKHGVGKTATVIGAFERHNLNWKYFSAATMDPWVDFIGIPKEKVEADGTSHIALVQPKGLQEVEALFLDELNRAPKKVRNAVMELIQFRSINGIQFPNLKMIWAAVNPDDDEDADTRYDVEALDPAQKDRFHIIVDIPYKPSLAFFSSKYGSAGEGAVEWWNALTPAAKDEVSPRRLEYALKVHAAGGSLRHVLVDNDTINISKLMEMMSVGSIKKKLRELASADAATRKDAFADPNFITNAADLIFGNKGYVQAFAEFVPKDILSSVLEKGDKKAQMLAANAPSSVTEPILGDLAQTLPKAKQKKLAKVYANSTAFAAALPPSIKPVMHGSLQDVANNVFVFIIHNTHNATYNRKIDLEKLEKRFAQAVNNKETISADDAIRAIMVLAAAVRRSQAGTVAAHTNHSWRTSTLGPVINDIEDHIQKFAQAHNLTMDSLAANADSDLRKKPMSRNYVRGQTGPTWSDTDFKKVRDRFGWWPV